MTTSTTPTDNPAGRLHRLLSKMAAADHNASSFDVMCTALNIEPRDWINFYRVWTKVLVLIDETESAIQVLPPRKQEIHAGFLGELRQHLSIANWSEQWSRTGGPLCDPECSLLRSIELCSWDLARNGNEIESQKLMELRQAIDELLREISSAQLSEEIRVFLISKLREIQRAIDDYIFYGSEGLRKALESILGAASLVQDVRDDTNPSIKKFWEMIKNVSSLLSLVSSAQRLAPEFVHLLTPAQDHL
jgi:hypothetical protein